MGVSVPPSPFGCFGASVPRPSSRGSAPPATKTRSRVVGREFRGPRRLGEELILAGEDISFGFPR